jgi:YD repeat-containing protein
LSAPTAANLGWTYNGSEVTSLNQSAPTFSAVVKYGYSHLLPVSEDIVDSTLSDNIVSTVYDRDSLPKQVGDLQIVRDPSSGLITQTNLGLTQENLIYDSQFGELKSYAVLFKGKQIYQESYSRDSLGRIIEKSVSDQNRERNIYQYTYDSSGRLVQVDANSRILRKYTYDANSNRTSVSEPGREPIKATFDAQDRLLTYGSRTFSYDGLGDRSLTTSDHGERTLSLAYDSLGGLVSAQKQMVIPERRNRDDLFGHFRGDELKITKIAYLNDGLGRRIEKSVDSTLRRGFVYDLNNRLIAELDSAGKIRSRFVYATMSNAPDYLIQNGVEYKIVHDQLGSVVEIVNSKTGKLASSIRYDEFGRVLSAWNHSMQPFGFAGGISAPAR